MAGIVAGLIQYFVDFRGLPLYQTQQESKEAFGPQHEPTWWMILYSFVKNNWQFYGYILIGIAGSFMTPLIDEMTNNRLSGLNVIKDYAECISRQIKGQPTCPSLSNWYYILLFGYGIVFGYSSVRIIRGLGSIVFGKLSLKQDEQQKKLDNAQKQIEELTTKLSALEPHLASKTTFATSQSQNNINDDRNAALELNRQEHLKECEENTVWQDYRVAESLKLLLTQINDLAPYRNKASDGTVGDDAHKSRDSDHNPWVWDKLTGKGVITALDITADPSGKCDCQILANSLQESKDERIKYVIWNSQIMNSSKINNAEAWTWRSYNGPNPHNKHIHISVKCEKENYDSKTNWSIKLQK
ncbi:MAG: hypothetical protein IPG01_13110 [Chitinophagaceae bacterium]|nr:hypothetical protein [Chitinophagaceae bacterium]